MWARKTITMKNPDKFVIPPDYKDLGLLWNKPIPEVERCQGLGHKEKTFNNSTYLHGSDDVIYICDECRHVYHVDSSD